MTLFKFFNTLTQTLDPFTPLKPPEVLLYTCGPTVYNFAHIGNFRTYMFEDVLRRSLTYFGYKVNHVMNITDVDDKTLKGAIEKGVTLKSFTEPYTEAFLEDLESLHILKADKLPKATDYIPEMIEMIQKLVGSGHAYTDPEGSVYFSINTFPSYGKLSHLDQTALCRGERVASDEYDKQNLSDFVLWKAYDPLRDGQIYWDSPFGPGRPGWHIECSAMATKLLGPSLDIHCGGVDNMFPHHENEIAQCEACTHKPFSRFWLHAQHLMVEGKKMSKSLGNFYTLRDLIAKGYSARAIRFVLVSSHYRRPLNFTFEGLDAAKASLQRLDSFMDRLEHLPPLQQIHLLDLEPFIKTFDAAILDDLNTPLAFSTLFESVRYINAHIDRFGLDAAQIKTVLHFMKKWDSILGFIFHEKEAIPSRITELALARDVAKKERNFKQADQIRDTLKQLGYLIEDAPSGYRITKI